MNIRTYINKSRSKNNSLATKKHILWAKKKSLENSTNALHLSQKIKTIENDSKVKNQKTEFYLSTLKPAEVKGPLPGAFWKWIFELILPSLSAKTIH